MRRVSVSIAALGLMIGVAVVGAVLASAAGGGHHVLYSVQAYKVCRHQGSTGASATNPWDPHSLYCYDLSIPAGITFGGDLDIQGYCSWKYPKSVAMIEEWNIFGWKRKRAEKP